MSDVEIKLKETKDRAQYFQSVQAWPLNNQLNYEGWISNFKSDEEIEIACLIIDFFIYYPNNMVDQMLKTAIGNAGFHLSKMLTDWKHEDFINRCFYSFIPGENPNPTDSGHIFARKIRDVLEIPEKRIIDFANISDTLSKTKISTPVILVDDFVGSGAQCIDAWNPTISTTKKGLKDISDLHGHMFIYSPLIVNQIGYNRIKSNCPGLILTPTHILGPEYNLFNKECFCWKKDEKLFSRGTELILRKSKELGIPFMNGHHTQDVRGFGEQGLAIAFEHGAPDAIPPIFYFCDNGWIPLINKKYHR